jgi:hypothetical protein
MSAKSHEPQLGSISSGTMRPEDLLEAFADELEWLRPRGHSRLILEARNVDTMGNEEKLLVLSDLFDALDECSPPYCYFGASEGDGACYGFWFSESALEDMPQFESTCAAREAKHVGEFYVTSDHGNVEIYVRYGNGRVKSILGVV